MGIFLRDKAISGSRIRDDFNRLFHDSGTLARQTAERARHATSDATHHALDGVRHTADRSREGILRGYHYAGDSIRDNPMQSILIAGAVGFLIGVAALAACSTCYQRYSERHPSDEDEPDHGTF
ncbi:hypothetical protein BH23VER1_BH23VER1_10720 [soil metagenome]